MIVLEVLEVAGKRGTFSWPGRNKVVNEGFTEDLLPCRRLGEGISSAEADFICLLKVC